MKVIHIVHGKANPNGNNGISRVVYYLNRYEKQQGIDSQIWAIVDGTKTHYTHQRDESVTVECYPRVKFAFSKNELIERLIAEKDTIDLVHFHLIWFYDKNIIASALTKHSIPFVITTHGTYSKPHAYTGKRLLAKWLFEKKYLNMASECHILTREEGTGLTRYGYHGKMFTVYNGFDKSEIPTDLDTDFFKGSPFGDRYTLLMVSVLRSDKNIPFIIEALAMLPKEIRDKFAFVLVGPDYKGNAARYSSLASELGVSDAFYWLGPLYGKDKYSAIKSADGYIMASFSEGFSMSVIDAMICGKPMILTSGCNMNYISDEPFFIKCEPYPQDIALAIKQYYELGEERYRLGEQARQIAEDKLLWKNLAQEMIANYTRIVNNGK